MFNLFEILDSKLLEKKTLKALQALAKTLTDQIKITVILSQQKVIKEDIAIIEPEHLAL